MRRIYDSSHLRPQSGPDTLLDESGITLDSWSSHKSSCWRSKMKWFEEGTRFELLLSTRAFLPLYIVDYNILGFPFRAAMPGCGSTPLKVYSMTDHKMVDPAFLDKILKGADAALKWNRSGRNMRSRRGNNFGLGFTLGVQALRFVVSKLPQFFVTGFVLGLAKKVSGG